jgi:hypothetical protein
MKKVLRYEDYNESVSLGGSTIGRTVSTAWRVFKKALSKIGITRPDGIKQDFGIPVYTNELPLFNINDAVKQCMAKDAETREFVYAYQRIWYSGYSDLYKRVNLVDLIDEHIFYIRKFKRSFIPLLESHLVELKYDLLLGMDIFKKFIDLKTKSVKTPNDKKIGIEFNNEIDVILHKIDATNLGLKFRNTLKDFREAIQNEKVRV